MHGPKSRWPKTPSHITSYLSSFNTHPVIKFARKLAKCVLSHAISSSCDLFLSNQKINVCFPPLTLLIFHDAFPRFTPLSCLFSCFSVLWNKKIEEEERGRKESRRRKRRGRSKPPLHDVRALWFLCSHSTVFHFTAAKLFV